MRLITVSAAAASGSSAGTVCADVDELENVHLPNKVQYSLLHVMICDNFDIFECDWWLDTDRRTQLYNAVTGMSKKNV
jgi:hypothetical protein